MRRGESSARDAGRWDGEACSRGDRSSIAGTGARGGGSERGRYLCGVPRVALPARRSETKPPGSGPEHGGSGSGSASVRKLAGRGLCRRTCSRRQMKAPVSRFIGRGLRSIPIPGDVARGRIFRPRVTVRVRRRGRRVPPPPRSIFEWARWRSAAAGSLRSGRPALTASTQPLSFRFPPLQKPPETGTAANGIEQVRRRARPGRP